LSELDNNEIEEPAPEYQDNTTHAKRTNSGTKPRTQRNIQQKKAVADQRLQSAQKPATKQTLPVNRSPEHAAAKKNEQEQSDAADEHARRIPEIPKFNLAEQILAEQRRISAVRRKGPGRASQIHAANSAEAAGASITESASAELPVEEIISEIVARDIEQMLHYEPASVPKDTWRSD